LTHLLHKEKLARAQDLPVSQSRSASKARAPGPVPVPRCSPTQAQPIDAPAGAVLCISIRSFEDILEARKQGRELAAELGFSSIDCTLVATAISELARNIVLYAGHGEIQLSRDMRLGATGIAITASDRGPGIRDLRNALQEGYSTSRGLGLGLPGVKRIMDEFDIESKPRRGTTVTVKKWKAM
jgi:serine/threonine-protein kinase RsbT